MAWELRAAEERRRRLITSKSWIFGVMRQPRLSSSAPTLGGDEVQQEEIVEAICFAVRGRVCPRTVHRGAFRHQVLVGNAGACGGLPPDLRARREKRIRPATHSRYARRAAQSGRMPFLR